MGNRLLRFAGGISQGMENMRPVMHVRLSQTGWNIDVGRFGGKSRFTKSLESYGHAHLSERSLLSLI